MADSTELSIVVVSWNVRELLRACLAALPRDAEVIVVDNASSDGSAAMIAAEFPTVRLVANQDNRGFTGGNNQGLALARGHRLNAEHRAALRRHRLRASLRALHGV